MRRYIRYLHWRTKQKPFPLVSPRWLRDLPRGGGENITVETITYLTSSRGIDVPRIIIDRRATAATAMCNGFSQLHRRGDCQGNGNKLLRGLARVVNEKRPLYARSAIFTGDIPKRSRKRTTCPPAIEFSLLYKSVHHQLEWGSATSPSRQRPSVYSVFRGRDVLHAETRENTGHEWEISRAIILQCNKTIYGMEGGGNKLRDNFDASRSISLKAARLSRTLNIVLSVLMCVRMCSDMYSYRSIVC